MIRKEEKAMKNIKRDLLIIGIISIIFLGAGCSVTSSSGSGGGSSYFPSTQGNEWVYRDSSGATSKITVGDTTTISNSSVTVQLFRTIYYDTNDNETSSSETYYKVDDTGVYYHGTPNYPSAVGIQMIAFPLEIGKTWQPFPGSSQMVGTVVGREDVTTPAGTFDCYKLELVSTYTNGSGSTESMTSTLWLGDNVGQVKTAYSLSSYATELESKNF